MRNRTAVKLHVGDTDAHQAPVGLIGALFAAPDPRARQSELIVHWDGHLTALRTKLGFAIDWGPFELMETMALPMAHDAAPRVLCRFRYHGPDDAKDHFEQNLHETLSHSVTCEAAVR